MQYYVKEIQMRILLASAKEGRKGKWVGTGGLARPYPSWMAEIHIVRPLQIIRVAATNAHQYIAIPLTIISHLRKRTPGWEICITPPNKDPKHYNPNWLTLLMIKVFTSWSMMQVMLHRWWWNWTHYTFQPHTPQRLFWNQQVAYNALKDKRQMRWHPLVIRFALNLSTSSYRAMRQSGIISSFTCTFVIYCINQSFFSDISCTKHSLPQLQ